MGGSTGAPGWLGRLPGRDWVNSAHENTKGRKGAARGRASARGAGVLVGSASADREIAKTRKNSETTEAHACATAPACPTESETNCLCAPRTLGARSPRESTQKIQTPNPPRIRRLSHGRKLSRLFSRFRVFAIMPSPTRTLIPRPDTPEARASTAPIRPFVFSCALLHAGLTQATAWSARDP